MKYEQALLDRFMSMAKQKLAKANTNIVLSNEYFDKIRKLLLTPLPEESKGAGKPTKASAKDLSKQDLPKEKKGTGLGSIALSLAKLLGIGVVTVAATTTPKDKTPRVGSSLKDTITQAEGTTDKAAKAKGFKSAYDVPYGYGKYITPDKPLSTMTLDEVDAFQIKLINATKGKVPGAKPTEGTSAVGKYQFIRPTLKSLTEDLPGSTIFSPQLQEKLGSKLIAQRIEQGGGDTRKTILALSQEFASLPMDESGRSFYGQPVGVSYNDLAQAVDKSFAADKIVKRFEVVMDKIKKGSDINNQGDPESDQEPQAQLVILPLPSANENAGGSSPSASSKSSMSGTIDKAGSLLLRLGLNAL